MSVPPFQSDARDRVREAAAGERPLVTSHRGDNPIRLARLTARYLENHGLLVGRELEGHAGVRAVARASFDVVLLDLTLPGMGGIEVGARSARK